MQRRLLARRACATPTGASGSRRSGASSASTRPGSARTRRSPPSSSTASSSTADRWPGVSPVELPPRTGKIEIHYDGLSFQAPEKVRFRYRLEGFEPSWVDAGIRRSAFYTSLPPGDFVFRVVAANNDGVWNETGARFAFRLKPGPPPAARLPPRGRRPPPPRGRDRLRPPDARRESAPDGAAEARRREDPQPRGRDPAGRGAAAAVGRGAPRGGGGEPGQEPLPREHEPRAPDAAERHPRLRRAPGRGAGRRRRARGRSRTSGRSAPRAATSSSSSATSSTSRRSRRAGWRSSPSPSRWRRSSRTSRGP